MEIRRAQSSELLKSLKPQKITMLIGAHGAGKSFLIARLLKEYKHPYLYLNGADEETHHMLSLSPGNFLNMLTDNLLLVIDNVQLIPDLAKKTRAITSFVRGLKILLTASSEKDLPPDMGAYHIIRLYPVWQGELHQGHESPEERLIYGSYPGILLLKTAEEKRKYLSDLIDSNLSNDRSEIGSLRTTAILSELLKLIATTIGQDISYNELGDALNISKNTVEKYLKLLTDIFVLYKMQAYRHQLHKEVFKAQRWYFTDNGIRNAMINNFEPLALRSSSEKAMLWQNYLFMERIKRNTCKRLRANYYFWRTYDRQKIDLLEVRSKSMKAFEFAYNSQKISKKPVAFAKAYPEADFQTVSDQDYLDFIL